MAANVFQPVELRRIRPKKIEGRRDAKWFLLRLQECDRRSAARRRRTRLEVRIEAAGEYGEIACREDGDHRGHQRTPPTDQPCASGGSEVPGAGGAETGAAAHGRSLAA